MTTAQPLVFEAPGRDEEERARADLYGVLASLFYTPPSPQLLEQLACTPQGSGGILDDSWKELTEAAANTDADRVRQEYEGLFIGVGKPEVMLYGSYYLSGFLMEKPLAVLRTDLAELGLQRAQTVAESEDHIASLCEVMRHLILSEDAVQSALPNQKKFFANHLQPWVRDFCAQLEAHPEARFYGAVARFACCYFEIEMQAFDLFA